MNELLFFFHLVIVTLFTFFTLRIGKEALISWICLQAILANLFVIKQISLFKLTVTSSDVFAIGGILGLNLLQEYFGKESSRRAIKICFYSMLFFSVLSYIHLAYVPSTQDSSQEAFSVILSPAPRLLAASLVVFYIVQKIDILLFAKLKNRLISLPFALRNLCSVSASQFIDTSLFTFLGLYGLVSSLFDIFLMSFFVKVLILLGMSPLIWVAKRYIRPMENA